MSTETLTRNTGIESHAEVVSEPQENTMKAIVQDRYGEAEVLKLEEIDRPTPADDEVLIRVRAAGVDQGVWHLMAGLPYVVRVAGFGLTRPKTRTPGLDVSGVVESVGKNVTRFKPGDEVFGTTTGTGAGSYAEFALAKEDRLVIKPEGLSFDEAAVTAISGLTALQGVRDAGEVQPGQKVLIVGASGGVGSYMVQIAKGFGAIVTGVASTAKVEMVKELGADHVIDYKQEDFTQRDETYDVIFDIGGNRKLRHLRRVLAKDGTLVIVGGEEGGKLTGGVQRQLFAMLRSAFTSQKLTTYISEEKYEDLEELKKLIEQGKLRPQIDRTFPLEQTADAIRYLRERKAKGKVVVSVFGS